MNERQSVRSYLAGPEDLHRKELVWGVLRDPPAPWCDHQSIVTHVLVLLATHVSAHALGRVLVSPVDVVLDEKKALVVQPDILFVSQARIGIIRNQIWGAPDLVVEVLSSGTRRRDCTNKLRWYRQYGVREYWMVDPSCRTVQVLSLGGPGRTRRRVARGSRLVHSVVLPGFSAAAREFFDDHA